MHEIKGFGIPRVLNDLKACVHHRGNKQGNETRNKSVPSTSTIIGKHLIRLKNLKARHKNVHNLIVNNKREKFRLFHTKGKVYTV